MIDIEWLYEEIYEYAELGMNLLDRDGHLLWMNQAYCQMFGYSKTELSAGVTWQDLTYPDDLELELSEIQVMQHDRSSAYSVEKRCVRKDGSIIWLKIHCVIIYDAQGCLRYINSILENISDRKQAEVIKDSEARFRNLVQHSFDIIYILDKTLTITYENPAVEQILGYPTLHHSLAECVALIHPDDQFQVRQTIQNLLLQPDIPIRFEYRKQHKNGSWIWLEAIGTNKLHEPAINGIIINARDTTDRKQVEQNLRRSEATNQAILQALPDHLIRLRRDGTYLQVIKPGELKVILAHEQVIPGVSMITALLPPHMAQERMAYIERAFQTGESQCYTYSLEVDGNCYYEEARIAICGEDEVLVIVRDITDLYQVEVALVESEATNRAILTAFPDLLMRMTADGYYVNMVEGNKAKAVQKLEYVVGNSAYDVLSHDLANQRMAAIRQALQTDQLQFYEQQVVVDGCLLDEEVRVIAINPTEALVLVRDITDRKNAERLLHQQAARDRALAQVTQAIRHSLDPETIFSTAVYEFARLLGAMQAMLTQHLPDRKIWRCIAVYSDLPEAPNAFGLEIPDHDHAIIQKLKQGEILCLANSQEITLELDEDDEHGITHYLAELYPGSWLILPIQLQTLWGGLALVKTTAPWQESEIELAKAITDQLAIAIQQSNLYEQVQHLNTDLERQVEERTVELQKALRFESLLKRITDKVRDSLDEAQILQTAVTELGKELEILFCNDSIYAPDLTSTTITHEYSSIQSSFGIGLQISFESSPSKDFLNQMLAKQTVVLCYPIEPEIQPEETYYAVLACPIHDDQSLLADLWLFKPKEATYNDLEIRLVQQVANQCAIAIRQSRLYQAAQAQVYELERLNQLKDDFLSTVSHELRTPMSSIKLATQMLEISLERSGMLANPTHQIDRYLKILQDECKRETTLINDLLDLSRLDSGADPLVICSMDLQYWLHHVSEPFLERVRQQNQQLIVDVSPDLPTLTTDFTYLELVLTELLHNACKYTPSGETIQINAKRFNTELTNQENAAYPFTIVIAVANSGIEIPSTELPHVFDKFYRVPNNDPWKHGGTGLGLALVKKRVERLQGVIAVSSMHNWTTFTLQLPQLLRS